MRRKIPKQEAVICCDDPCFLVTSRPGRGKTSVALWFAEHQLKQGELSPSQKILFLTFSRNAVYQISTASGSLLDKSIQSRLQIATYHSFMWWLIQTFGRYSGLPPQLELIWETKARSVTHGCGCEQLKLPFFLACQAGGITYDCFAPLTLSLLKSKTVRKGLAGLFPIIVVDEFQDTNDEQWDLIKLLAKHSRIGCFADPDQMIHRFRGASDIRLSQLISEQGAKHYKLQDECLRTDDHDLLDFAEAILDNRPVSTIEKKSWKKRFLVDYHGPNARSTSLKMVLHNFKGDFNKRNKDASPSIALAGYSNNTAALIRSELKKPTKKFNYTISCKILEPDEDESIEDLILHTALWNTTKSIDDLKFSIRIIGSIISPKDISKASGPIQSLFYPDALLSGSRPLKLSAKTIVETLRSYTSESDACTNAIVEAGQIINDIGDKIRSFGKKLESEKFEDRLQKLLTIAPQCSGKNISEELFQFKTKLKNERLQRCVIQRVTPIKGRVVATMHKLKGKEFDYVAIFAGPGDTFKSRRDEPEIDARRLLYVSLTRARYDARILYMGYNPPPILTSFI
jgi:DNA helicase II / ATP-dependent DNA helicase PcrA